MVLAYFENIRKEILSELSQAENSIQTAVYWFTNHELFDALCASVEKGIKVDLIVHNDYINNREKGLNFQKFIDLGGNLFFSSRETPMHNKFCIIDKKVVINGSYNWTYYAESKNFENITVIKDDVNTVEAFEKEFSRLIIETNSVSDIDTLTKFEIDDFATLNARDYLANDLVFYANESKDTTVLEEAFEIAPDNISVQKEADSLGLLSHKSLKHSIGSSLVGNKYLIIIPKGSSIPFETISIVKTAEDNQNTSKADILYGEEEFASWNQKIGEIRVTGIPAKPAGMAQMKYFASIDYKGILRLKKVVLDTGRTSLFTKDINNLLE